MKPLLLTLILIFTAGTSLQADDTSRVEGSATCQRFNDVWNKWYTDQIIVYVDEQGGTYVKIGNARGHLTSKLASQLVAALQKGQEWATKAQSEKIDVRKDLGSFLQQTDSHNTGVTIKFVSTNGGSSVGFLMEVFDFDNEFIKSQVIVAPAQLAPFSDLLKRAPDEVKKLKESKKKGELFK